MRDLIGSVERALSLGQHTARVLQQVPYLTGSLEPLADPLKTYSQHLLSLGNQQRLRYGMIVDYVPHVRVYRVLPDGGGPLLLCVRTTSTGTSALGVADGDTLSPGDRVVLTQSARSYYSEILAVLPHQVNDPRQVKADYIVQGSNAGILVDAAHRAGFLLGPQGSYGGIPNFGSRMPLDSLAGEFCRMTETGLLLFMDAEMACLRVDELTGLWLWYEDQLVRLAGYNWQHWTSGSVEELMNDEGEIQHYRGFAVYPWEQLGQIGAPRTIAREISAKATQQESPWLASLEPTDFDLQPFHRIREFGGYLGQGRKTQVVAPPPGSFYRYNNEGFGTGLSESLQLLSGQLAWRSAKGIILAKWPTIPPVHRKRVPVDPEGDRAGNYRGSGFYGEGEGKDHKLADGPTAQSPHASPSKVAASLDWLAYAFNWAGQQGVHYHENDFHLPEEGEGLVTRAQTVPQFGQAATKAFLDPPTPVEVEVDHRLKVQVFPNNAYIALLDEGGIVSADGYGAEIVLSNGKVRINTALDIEIGCGRTVAIWGGRDVVLRAKNSIDLTATKNDIRVFAGGNVQIVGAVAGGTQGVLIESRSSSGTYVFDEPGHDTQHGGILLRTKSAPIAILGNEVYLHSESDLVLDANKGSSNAIVNCARLELFVGSNITEYFGQSGAINGVNVWQYQSNFVQGSLYVDGELANKGSHVLQGNVLVTQGHIFTQVGSENVARLEGAGLAAAQARIRSNSSTLQRYQQQGQQAYQSDLEAAWYATGKAGSDQVLEKASGSLRTVEQYGTSEFVMFEPRWGQMARLGGQTVGDWNENPVDFNGTSTYCWPGQAHFEGTTLYAIDLSLFDTDRGVSKTRGEAYEDPKLNAARAGSLHAYPTLQ